MSQHLCHWPGCNTPVPPRMWGCRSHWYTLPKKLRDKVWATFRPGQEISKNPTPAYLSVADEIQEWCCNYIEEHNDGD